MCSAADNLEGAKAAIDAAEAMYSPVILQVSALIQLHSNVSLILVKRHDVTTIRFLSVYLMCIKPSFILLVWIIWLVHGEVN